MATEKVYVFSTPTISLNTYTDLSGYGDVYILFERPDGSHGQWTGAVYDTTYVRYKCGPADLNMPGRWRFQSHGTGGPGSDDLPGERISEYVYPRLHVAP